MISYIGAGRKVGCELSHCISSETRSRSRLATFIDAYFNSKMDIFAEADIA